MPTMTRNGDLSWKHRATATQLRNWAAWLIGIAIVSFAWHLISEKTIWFFVQDAPRQAADMGARMVPPKWSYMSQLWKPAWDTVNIATIGTIIAMVIAIPVAFAAARNTTPHLLVRSAALFIIVSSRSVNSLIWALMLVFILGPGILAGTIAIGLRSVGFCAKLLYEAIEEIDQSQVEAIEATGASRVQKIVYGILPQVMPTIAGVGIYRWDINIRESTILGLVGAGGIGLQLSGSLNTLAWTQVSMILLVILATVFISEWVSAKVRGAII
ncbi:phosphonate ABC transporter, permease protein PhnE [bacterium]|jgi:phosphonate transport system permease protein|nr:phosphonate ABC transporter, permease protein PhnE [bacterium]|tara:strand:+ start:475 stop:1287 length:813 start_codon:yes stop_codon:yes gene_type:complete